MSQIHGNWTTIQEDLCKKYWNDAQGYQWKHRESAKFYQFINFCIGCPTIIIGAIVAALSTLISNDDCDNSAMGVIAWVITGFSMLSVVLTTLNQFLKLEELAANHKNSADLFGSYADQIETELSLPKKQRLAGILFTKQAQKKHSELVQICPNINYFIESRFKSNKKNIPELKYIVIDENKEETTNDNDDSSTNSSGNNSDNLQGQFENMIKQETNTNLDINKIIKF